MELDFEDESDNVSENEELSRYRWSPASSEGSYEGPHLEVDEVTGVNPVDRTRIFERHVSRVGTHERLPFPALDAGAFPRGAGPDAESTHHRRFLAAPTFEREVHRHHQLPAEAEEQARAFVDWVQLYADRRDLAAAVHRMVPAAMHGLSERVPSGARARFFLDFDSEMPDVLRASRSEFFPAVVRVVARVALGAFVWFTAKDEHDLWCVVLQNFAETKRDRFHVVFPGLLVLPDERRVLMQRVCEALQAVHHYAPDAGCLHSLRMPFARKVYGPEQPLDDFYFPQALSDGRWCGARLGARDVATLPGRLLLVRAGDNENTDGVRVLVPLAAGADASEIGSEQARALAREGRLGFHEVGTLATWQRDLTRPLTMERAEQIGLIDFLNSFWVHVIYGGARNAYYVAYREHDGQIRWQSKTKTDFLDMCSIKVPFREHGGGEDDDDDDEEDTEDADAERPPKRSRGGAKMWSLGKIWMASSQRRIVHRVVSDPFPPEHGRHVRGNVLNLFRPGMLATDAAWEQPVVDVLLAWHVRMFGGNLVNTYMWLGGFANLMDKPYEKLGFMMCLVSRAQGIGKSLMIQLLRRMFGENAATISNVNNLVGFNMVLANKLLLVLEEADLTKQYDTLKHYITADTLEVTAKFADTVEVLNAMTLVGSFNEASHVPRSGAQDRRFHIMGCERPFPAAQHADLGQRFYTWLFGEHGADDGKAQQFASWLRSQVAVFRAGGCRPLMPLPPTAENLNAANRTQDSAFSYAARCVVDCRTLLFPQEPTVLKHAHMRHYEEAVRAHGASRYELRQHDDGAEAGVQFHLFNTPNSIRNALDPHTQVMARLWAPLVPEAMQYEDYKLFCQDTGIRMTHTQHSFLAALQTIGVAGRRMRGLTRMRVWPASPQEQAETLTASQVVWLDEPGAAVGGSQQHPFVRWCEQEDPLRLRRFQDERSLRFVTDALTNPGRAGLPFDDWEGFFCAASDSN